jgi:hypothetical protein
MNTYKHLKKVLLNTISSLASNYSRFLVHPDIHFSRTRKLSFEDMISFLLCMEAGSIKDELFAYFGLSLLTPTASAFVQQRQKIKADAFEWLFHSFNQQTKKPKDHLYNGFRLLAVDGSSIPISHDPQDLDTYMKHISKHHVSARGHNAFHLNAVYDVLEHTYEDVVIQGEALMNENGAFHTLIDRYQGEPAIFIADRGYESYNNFAHVIEANNKFLIRVKDIHSKTSLAGGLELNKTGEFDVDIHKILTKKQTKEIKQNTALYKFVPSTSTFDYMDKENPYYEMDLRVVRFKITDTTYECIITNLDRTLFPVGVIKELYHLRWSIETSFRELKYVVGMNAFHSKNRESIKQEIYAKLVLYNFSQRIIRTIKPKKVKDTAKHVYQINYTRAFVIIRKYLKYKKGGKEPPDIESILAKKIEPIRKERSNPRRIRNKSPVSFQYRFH